MGSAIRGDFGVYIFDTYVSDFILCLILWAGLFVAFFLTELFTSQFFAIWFSVGSIGALIAALFDVPPMLQLLIFALLTALLIVFIRPIAYKLLKIKYHPTNSDLIIGKEGVVISSIDNLNGRGRVRVGGLDWAAKSENGSDIGPESVVIIKRIEGVTLVVAPKFEN